jgi:glycosyltransferase involved in cell wall biosynthesis
MKTPVVIAAYNEASMISRTLDNLDAAIVEPHVIANGCQDETADIARSYGAIVYEEPEAGKLPAIQTVLHALGDRALSPVLYLDADSFPLRTRSWHRRMTESLSPEVPTATSGPIILDSFGPSGLIYDTKYYMDSIKARRKDTVRFRGANMATHFRQEAALKRILELPHIWPGEDHAMELALLSEGGTTHQVTHPGAMVMTSSRYTFPIIDFVTAGRKGMRQKSLDLYKERAAAGSIPLGIYLRQKRQ